MDSDQKSNTNGSLIDEQNDVYDESESDPGIYEGNKDPDANSFEKNEDSNDDSDPKNEDRDKESEGPGEEDKDQDADGDQSEEDEDSGEDQIEEDEGSGGDQMEEDEDERELEQHWNQRFIEDASFSSTEVKGHTTITFTQVVKPIDVFNKFFTDDVIDLMVKQTNIYGKKKSLLQNRTSTWQPVNRSTIRSFLGLLILMSLHRLPRLRDYWSRNKIFHTKVVADVMSRDEFYRIFTAFHLSDNTKQDQFDKSSTQFKLYKVFDFISLLKRNFQRNFILGTNVCIDESMIKFKGRSSLKQYIPLKPVKRGFKVWCLADSSTGYLYNFDIYCGRKENRKGTLGEDVVLHLINKINLVDHRLFFDNFFTAITLLLQLQNTKIRATGTIRTNRKLFPKELLRKDKLKRGEYKYRASGQISVVKWQDKKSVFIASNIFDPMKTATVTRREKNGSKQVITCPEVVSQYNKYKGGVDLFDQRISCYSIDRKSKRNWIRIFLHFFQASLSNAFICYNDLRQPKLSYLQFLCSVSTSLIADHNLPEKKGRPVHLSVQKRNIIQQMMVNEHAPSKLLAHMPVVGFKGRCRYCSTKAKTVFSTVKCSFCNVSLCVKRDKNCFLSFHETYV